MSNDQLSLALDRIANEMQELKRKLDTLSDKLDHHNIDVEKTLLASVLMKLENNCVPYLKEDRYKHVPSFIKKASGASRLFSDKAWHIHVKSRKLPDKEWEEELDLSAENDIFLYIVTSDIRTRLHDNNFNMGEVEHFISGVHDYEKLTEHETRCLSLHKLFTSKDESYMIGDKPFIKIYDPRLGKKSEYAYYCTIVDIEFDDYYNCPEITIRLRDDLYDTFDLSTYKDSKCFYKAIVFGGFICDKSNKLILQSGHTEY